MIIVIFVIRSKKNIMSNKIKYSGLNLPETLVEELKIWKMAYALAYGRTISYAEMIRKMIDIIPEHDPAVKESVSRLLEMNPELAAKIANKNGGEIELSK